MWFFCNQLLETCYIYFVRTTVDRIFMKFQNNVMEFTLPPTKLWSSTSLASMCISLLFEYCRNPLFHHTHYMLVFVLLLFCWYNLYTVTYRLAASQLAIGLLILPLHAVTTAINNHLLNSLAIYQNHPHFIDIKLDSLQILDHHATGIWVGILVNTNKNHLQFIGIL